MSEDSESEAIPTYVVIAHAQQGYWHLTVDLPHRTIGHTVRNLEDREQVVGEIRAVIANRLETAEDAFTLELVVDRPPLSQTQGGEVLD